jgi:phosphate transport system substrate-binding protein
MSLRRSFLSIAVAAALCGPGGPALAQALTGAGATFPFPIYSKWFDTYQQETGVRVNYQSIGSGGGIRQVLEGTVDFGATDGPMSDEEMARAPGEILHIPMVLGAVVVVYNVPGLPSGLKLDGPTLAGIFLGEITEWDDSRIASQNPGANLPNEPILVVHRSDGSGTTYVFSDYLSHVSTDWSARVGTGKALNWPTGLGGKGNEGVAGQVKQTPGTIGYVELAYAKQNALTMVQMKNRSGRYVSPSLETTTAAAEGIAATLGPDTDFRISIVNAPGEVAYPIASFTWQLVYREQQDRAKGQALVDLLWWETHAAQEYPASLDYAPLPHGIVELIEGKLRTITYAGHPLLAAGM